MIKYIRQNDTKPFVRAVLATVSGDPATRTVVDLSSATVKFIMREVGSTTAKVDATLAGGEIVDATNGEVQYEWDGTEGDTDTCGDYLVEFQVTDSESYVMTFWDMRTASQIDNGEVPEPLIVRIVDDLA